MKTRTDLFSILLSVLLLSVSQSGAAVSTLSRDVFAASDAVFELKGRNGRTELCAVPAHFDDSRISQSKADRKDEVKLCQMSLAATDTIEIRERTPGVLGDLPVQAKSIPMAACPKLNSTNPGTLFVKIPKGWTQEQAESEFCRSEAKIRADLRELVSVEAKLKSSITCSYTPSALAGYHVSRLLGMNRVPVAVLRTMDVEHHRAVVEKANGILGSSAEIIAKAWRMFDAADEKARAGSPAPKIYFDKGAVLYGGLQKNLKGEDRYTEVSGRGIYETRYFRFLEQAPFKRVADDRSLDGVIAGKAFSAVFPIVSQMTEVSDMVLFDSLLSQDDRIGNIHYKVEVAQIVDDAGGLMASAITRKLLDDEKTKLEAAKKAAGLVQPTSQILDQVSKHLFPDGKQILVRTMYLKDNDCGVDIDNRKNWMRSIHALEKVRHMSGATYRRFLKFADDVLSDRFKSFALDTLLYRESDYEGSPVSLKGNVLYALKTLKANCQSRALKLDLDVTYSPDGTAVAAQPVSCD